jgi:phytoene synthase
LACIYIWGFRGDEALEPARKCGIAFQMTNILRDLEEDAQQGRVYLPREDLRRFEYSEEDLRAGVVDARFDRLMQFEIDRARRFYHQGADLFDRLEPDGRRIFGMMISVYHRLLERIGRRPREVFGRRVRLSRWQKLSVAARWALLPAGRSALP